MKDNENKNLEVMMTAFCKAEKFMSTYGRNGKDRDTIQYKSSTYEKRQREK